MATPDQVDVWVGLDVGKEEHFAEVLDDTGERLFARSVVNDQAALEALLDRAAKHGTPGMVVDQPGSIAPYARRDALSTEVEEAFLAHPFGELLSTLPGIGPRTGQGLWPRAVTGAASPTPTSSPRTPA